jgi:hypothetical protein
MPCQQVNRIISSRLTTIIIYIVFNLFGIGFKQSIFLKYKFGQSPNYTEVTETIPLPEDGCNVGGRL